MYVQEARAFRVTAAYMEHQRCTYTSLDGLLVLYRCSTSSNNTPFVTWASMCFWSSKNIVKKETVRETA